MYTWLLVLLVTVLVWAWRSTRRPSWSPHGPPLVPWLGNLLSMDTAHLHQTYSAWAETYGAIYHLKLGAAHQVVLTDPELIRDAFGRLDTSGRPNSALFQFILNGCGLVSATGELWQVSRRFTLHHLRNLGMGKSHLESDIHHQITGIIDQILTPHCGKEVDINAPLKVAVVNIIWKMVASEELDITDHTVHSTMTNMSKSVEFTTSLGMLDAFPWLETILPDFVFRKAEMEKRYTAVIMEALNVPLEKHRKDLEVNCEPRDYMEALLQQQQKQPDLLTDWHLLMCLFETFVAGYDTTATTLRWALCFLCSRPECQRRMQAELDAQVGRERLPSLADRPRLPYTEAVLLETQRLADTVPMLLPHQTLVPVTVGGYHLPAGVQIIGNAHAVHRSERLFAEPLEFRPERFLDGDGHFRPDKNVIPFSVGKRQCLGESMARAELFLFLTAFMQSFSFRWPEGFQHDLSEDPMALFFRSPAPYRLVPERR